MNPLRELPDRTGEIADLGNIAAEFAGVASGFGIFGVSKYAAVPLTAFAVWVLIVYGSYLRWTGDRDFARRLLPAAEAALRWIDEYGDRDGDGFVEYETRSPGGMLTL